MNEPRDLALRPLHAVADARSALRDGGGDPDDARLQALRVARAAEASLRRVLRDDPAQPLETRLRALAADELPADALISALRQHDRISIELAAAFHDLLAVHDRLQRGGSPSRPDVELVLGVAERLERELYALRLPAPSPDAVPATSEAVEPVEAEERDGRAASRTRRGPAWPWFALAAAVLALILAGALWTSRRGGDRMDEAIALFRTGDFERAAERFERHAAARPADATPRLYLARIHRRAGRFDDAGEQLRLALEVDPDDAALHRELGLLLLDLGRTEAAVGRFRAAVERDPGSSEGWLGLVRALRESGQPDVAERVAARAPADVRARLQAAPADPR